MYQSDTKSHTGWSQNVLKYIAMGTMLLNHIAAIFLPAGTVLCELFTAVGYFTAISMVYFWWRDMATPVRSETTFSACCCLRESPSCRMTWHFLKQIR